MPFLSLAFSLIQHGEQSTVFKKFTKKKKEIYQNNLNVCNHKNVYNH